MNAGVPAGHPFFGNQYTKSDYELGTYTYTAEIIERIDDSLSTMAVEEIAISPSSISVPDYSEALVPQRNTTRVGDENVSLETALMAIGSAVIVAGGLKLWDYLSTSKKQKDRLRAIADANVCLKCKKSLSGGKLSLPKKRDKNAYIECPYCKQKHIALAFSKD